MAGTKGSVIGHNAVELTKPDIFMKLVMFLQVQFYGFAGLANAYFSDNLATFNGCD